MPYPEKDTKGVPPVTRPTISVYTCALNEAKHIERWYESAKTADHLLILDTGSDDATVEVAKACGIDTHRSVMRPFRFDDARNAAMSLIPPSIDIVIQLDADEVFATPDWRDNFDDVSPNHHRWSYWLRPARNSTWVQSKRENAHRRHGFRWAHPVHELIVGPPSDAHLDGLVIEHHPDTKKDRRYLLPMLQAAVAEEPDNARMRFYLGREYKFRHMQPDARATLRAFLAMPSEPPMRSEAYLLLAKMNQDPAGWLWRAIAECPERREPFVYLAEMYRKQGNGASAHALITMAEHRTAHIYLAHSQAWGDKFQKLKAQIERMPR